MTGRFKEYEGIIVAQAEEPVKKVPAPVRAATAIKNSLVKSAKKDTLLAAYVAGLLSGGLLVILGGLVR